MTGPPADTHLLLHVGRSKTGTTALQRFLDDNRAGLRAAGLLLPDFFIGSNHADLAIAYSARPGALAEAFAVAGPADQERLRGRISGMLRERVRPGQTWLFTSEHLAARLRSRQEVAHLLGDLGRHFHQITVIAQVRRPDYLAPSRYGEYVKSFGRRRFDAGFVARSGRTFDHRAVTGAWTGHGVELVLLPYVERYRRDPGQFFADWMSHIAAICGTDVVLRGWTVPDGPDNASLSAAALEYLRRVNRTGRRPVLTGAGRRSLIEALGAVPGKPPPLTPGAHDALARRALLTGGLSRAGGAPAPPGRAEPVEQLWREWFDQPDAPMGPACVLTDAQMEDIEAICREQGADPRGRMWLDRLPAPAARQIRRTAIRVRRG